MDEAEICRYITEEFPGVDVVADSGNRFFFYNPDPSVPPDHRFPIITLVTNDLYDSFSNLNRPSVYRLNIGVGKQTFRSLFGENPGDYDFTALDRVMPHPVYGRMHWVCVLNPSEETFQTKVRPLLAEAYDLAVSKHNAKESRKNEG